MTNMAEPQAAAAVALALATARCGANAASAWADEVGRFMGHRLATDAQYVRALSACASPIAAATATAAFMDHAAADYADFARRARRAVLAVPAESLRSAQDGFAPPGPLPLE